LALNGAILVLFVMPFVTRNYWFMKNIYKTGPAPTGDMQYKS
jgi:hypothetical protein